MAKAVISSILESQLGKYVDGLSSDSLQVGLWSGELVLTNLSLKPHALAELELPVTVVHGTIERIHVVVPWNQLGSASVQVTIDGIYALVAPNAALPTRDELVQAKANSVERHELVRQHNRFAAAHNSHASSQDHVDESTFLSRLTERIVDNLHVTLQRIHVRYEDSVSRPDAPFACGVVIERFAFHTTDADGRDVFLDRTARAQAFVHKRVTLAQLGVYWDRVASPAHLVERAPSIERAMAAMIDDLARPGGERAHAWLLRPCALAVQLTKNESLDYSRAAKFTVHAKLSDLALGLAREQYEDVLFVHTAFVGRRAIEAHYLHARGRPFHDAVVWPRAWWDYAVRLVLAGRRPSGAKRTKPSRLRWSTIQRASAERRAYVEAFRLQLRKSSGAAPALDPLSKPAMVLKTYERAYPVDVVMVVRDVAQDAEEAAAAKRRRAESAASQSKAASASGSSWYGYFFGGSGGAAAASASSSSTDKVEDVLTAEGRANLKQAYDEVATKQQQAPSVPPGCNLVSVKLQLANGSLTLFQSSSSRESVGAAPLPLLTANASGSLHVNVQPSDAWDARFRLQRFEVLNGMATGTAFHMFCSLSSAAKVANPSLPCLSVDAKVAPTNTTDAPSSSSAVGATLRVRVAAMPIRVMLDPSFVLSVQDFFESLLPEQQLERVWSFATSSVSDWIFADDDDRGESDSALLATTLEQSQRAMQYDVAVDMSAPVVVVPESVADPRTSVVVVDLGQVALASDAVARDAATLRWRLDVSNVQLLLGRLDALNAADDSDFSAFATLVEQLNLAFAVETLAPTLSLRPPSAAPAASLEPNVSVRATIPHIAVTLAQDQLIALARIHSSLLAQAAAVRRAPHDGLPVSTSASLDAPATPAAAPPAAHATALRVVDKHHLHVHVALGALIVTLRESAARDAFRLCVSHLSCDASAFTTQYVVQAKLQALVLEDLLYDPTSRFRQLLSTGAASDTHLVALDVTLYPLARAAYSPTESDTREALDAVADLRVNVLDVQWNPSSMSLMYRIATSYVLALQHHSADNGVLGYRASDATPERPRPVDVPGTGSAAASPAAAATAASETRPTILARASLVQFSVTFNKDDVGRQLVQLAMKDASLEFASRDVGAAPGAAYALSGHLGNFIATDLSLAKHPVYSPLVGLDESAAASAPDASASPRRRRSALLTFSYAFDPVVSAKSVLTLALEPVRMVYYHQQVLELVDYLFEGILGTMVTQTLASATQLLLSEAESSVVFDVAIAQPTVVLPVRMTDPNHVELTAALLRLTHAPTSAVHYYGSGPVASRRRVVRPNEALTAAVVSSSDCVSLRLDHKHVALTRVNVVCVVATDASSSAAPKMTTQSVIARPIDLSVDVDDLVSSDRRLDETYLPRFAITVAMADLVLLLQRPNYVQLVGVITDNFGAEQLQVAASRAATDADDAGRPSVAYSYSRTDLDAVTMDLTFVMQRLQCVLYEASDVAVDALDRVAVDSAARAFVRPHERAVSEIVARDVAMALHFARDASPRLAARMATFVVQELAPQDDDDVLRHLVDADASTRTKLRVTSESPGVLVVCTEPTQVSYVWDDAQRTCELELLLSSATGVLVPEPLLQLVDFFTVAPSAPTHALAPVSEPSSNSREPPLKRRQSITELVLDATSSSGSSTGRPEYAMTVRLCATRLAIDVPQTLDRAVVHPPRLSLGADVSVEYTWKPPSARREASSSASDLDIQSSVIVDARAIEVVVKHANRQGCRARDDGSALSDGHVAAMVQLLEPCDLHVEINDLFPHAGQQQQIVAFRFTPIELFVSYDDACIGLEALRTFNASLAQYARVRGTAAAPPTAPSGVLSPKAFASSSSSSSSAASALVATDVEIHRYFTCEVASMRLTVINDCDGCDMGLVQMQMQRCNVFMNVTYAPTPLAGAAFPPPATVLSGGAGVVLMLSYYNPDTRTWHEMCRDWGLDVSLQGSIYSSDRGTSPRTAPPAPSRLPDNELHVIVTASQPLELLVTHGLLEVVASAGGAWNRRVYGTNARSAPSPSGANSPRTREAREKKKHAPCVVSNETGLSVRFWLTDGHATTPAHVVASGELADLHYIHTVGRGSGVVRTYASADRAETMRLCIELLDTAFQPVRGIIFEQLGSRAFPLVDASGSASHFTLNCYAQLVDGRILLALSSQMKLVNTLSMPVQLLVNDPTWPSPVDIGILDPARESAIPVLLSLGTELRVRPIDDAFSWSAPIPVQTRAALEQTVEAASNGAADVHSAIYCVALAIEQSLRVVSLSEPIVLVNKLPVEVEYRIKSPLLNRPNASTTRQVNTVGVGASSGIWWTNSTQRPQFKLCVQGCKPSKWIELVHPGTTSGDVVAVMLERRDGRALKLLIQVVEYAAKSMHVYLYAEVWFINRTGLELVYGNDADAEAYVPPLDARALVGNAQICAFSSDTSSGGAPVVRLRMDACGWSSRFTADPRRLSWQDECLSLRSDRRMADGATMLYEFGVSADYATRHFGSLTTLVSVIPRYLVLNRTAHTVLLLEDAALGSAKGHGNTAHHILARGDVYALYWVTGARCKLHASVITEHSDFGWSKTFSIDHVATTDVAIPAVAHGVSSSTERPSLTLQVAIKRGSISQSTFVVVITEASSSSDATSPLASPSSSAAAPGAAHAGWDTFTLHTQIAGVTVTVADKKLSDESASSTGGGPRSAEKHRALGRVSQAFASDAPDEPVARLTISRISVESSVSRHGTSAKMHVMGVKIDDLLANSSDPVVLRPVLRSGPYDPYRGGEKYFLEVTYVEKPHAKYTYVEQVRVEVQDVKITTSMRFVDRLNGLVKETIAHFERRALSSASRAASSLLRDRDEHLLEYFVTSAASEEDDASMASLTGQKLYVESCVIAPVRVVVSFSRDKRDVRAADAKTQGFWLANLKLKIENACLTLDAYKLTHALATQEALVESLASFYVKSVKSQALGLIESIQVTSLVTSMVTGGVSSLMSTILGKTDPSLAAASTSRSFQYQFQTNAQIMDKHSRLLAQCRSSTQFLDQVRHLVFDWDSNHTGLEARGCVALGLLNNSRHALVLNTRLNDGAEIRVLPLGRRALAGAGESSSGSAQAFGQTTEWRADRAVVVFAWGYTPTLLTSGDVYFTVQSNACNVFVTRKTARLKANLGYTATFTHQETQSWWSTNVVIVGDDIQAHTPSSAAVTPSHRLSIDASPSDRRASAAANATEYDLFGSASQDSGGRRSSPAAVAPPRDEYEVVFTTAALGIIAKQSGRAVIVRELCALPSGAPGPALACGEIAPGDSILAVSGMTVTNTTQFAQLVSQSPRPVVLRFRRTSDQASSAYDLFGEAPRARSRGSSARRPSGADNGAFDLFGAGPQQ